MKFLFKYPTRGRPQWFKETLAAYQSRLSGKHKYQWIVSVDQDDKTMVNLQMAFWFKQRPEIILDIAANKSKVEAINSGMTRAGDYDIAVLVSDDMIPVNGSFDDVIAEDMQKYFPNLDGCLHYDDGFIQHQNCIVQSIIGRKLMERFGNRFYWPEYHSLWCDVELTLITRREGKYQWLPNCIIKHEWKKYGCDETYNKSDAKFHSDGVIYERRKALDFPGGIELEAKCPTSA